MPARILLIHCDPAEAGRHLDRLRRAGFEAEYLTGSYGNGYRLIREQPPDGVVIDLSRQPSHGREAGIHLRRQKATREIGLVFVEGNPEKTAQVRALLPDAVVTSWARIVPALRSALKHKPERPVVPGTFAGYAGTPLARKLRIGENCAVALLHAPAGFAAKLEPLPPGVEFRRSAARAKVILAFMNSEHRLQRELPLLAAKMPEGGTLWLIWPKKSSGMHCDLTQARVRKLGLEAGLVDYKICALDETWSGLAFALRRQTSH